MQEDCEVSDKAIIRRLKQIAFSSKNDMASLKALGMLGQITGLLKKEETKVTTNMITISVEDKEQKQLEDCHNGQIIGSSFEVIDDDNNGE